MFHKSFSACESRYHTKVLLSWLLTSHHKSHTEMMKVHHRRMKISVSKEGHHINSFLHKHKREHSSCSLHLTITKDTTRMQARKPVDDGTEGPSNNQSGRVFLHVVLFVMQPFLLGGNNVLSKPKQVIILLMK